MALANWIVYLGVAFGGFLVGASLVGFFYYVGMKLHDRILKKKIPPVDDMRYQNPGKTSIINLKEVAEDDRRKFEKFREFERLRRLESTNGKSNDGKPFYETSVREPERVDIPNKLAELDKKPDTSNVKADRSSRKSIDWD